MGKKIVLGCYEIPGYGGANTASYKLFEVMRKNGLNVSYLNIIDEQDADYFRYVFGEEYGNPKNLDNVYNCVLDGRLFAPHPELGDLIKGLTPDILIGVGHIASLLMKRAAQAKDLIYLTTGCDQAKQYISDLKVKDLVSLLKLINLNGRIDTLASRENEAVEVSDFVIAHSDAVASLYKYFFPYQSGKIHSEVIWFADWIQKEALEYSSLRKAFSERDIDLLFVSSIWSRSEKNYRLVKKIISQCKDLRIHIIGEGGEEFASVKYHGLITRRDKVFSVLGRTKTVVSASILDAAPGVLFEASAMGCNIVASKNCGNWEICNRELLVEPFGMNDFLEKIRLSLSKKYKDNIDYFLEKNSYNKLIDLISIF